MSFQATNEDAELVNGEPSALEDTTAIMAPETASAAEVRLPDSYRRAVSALNRCVRIDEVKDWKDKATALASYARQRDDETLLNQARRIRLRASRRCGELLREIEPAQGERTDKPRTDPDTRLTRTQVATEAGLSKRQKDTALRVAAVPAETFEELVESETPPTETKLAELGTSPALDLRSTRRSDQRATAKALAWMHEAQKVDQIDVEAFIRAASDAELAAFRGGLATIAKGVARVLDKLVSPAAEAQRTQPTPAATVAADREIL